MLPCTLRLDLFSVGFGKVVGSAGLLFKLDQQG
jgi:hypothetical protein